VILATRNELQKRHKLDQQQPKRPSATD
jgi:hypothetical protein